MSEDAAVTHRVYDMEVIELSEEVSFLLLLPPVENVCSVPGHTEEITENPNYLTLPVQVFEMSKFFIWDKLICSSKLVIIGQSLNE